jgi:hypothetical protein
MRRCWSEEALAHVDRADLPARRALGLAFFEAPSDNRIGVREVLIAAQLLQAGCTKRFARMGVNVEKMGDIHSQDQEHPFTGQRQF